MKIKFYTLEPQMYLHPTEFGVLLCKSEDISNVPRERLQLAASKGCGVNQQYKQRILLNSGDILHSMNPIPALDVPSSNESIGEMIVLCDQQMYVGEQKWLVNAVSLNVVKRGVAPEFFGYPHLNSDTESAVFTVTYRDGSTKTYRQRIRNLSEDVSVETMELQTANNS